MYKDISISVPAEVNLSEQELKTKAQEALLCNLYAEDKVSEVQACQLLNVNRRQFHKLLQQYHVSSLHTDEDFEDELHFATS